MEVKDRALPVVKPVLVKAKVLPLVAVGSIVKVLLEVRLLVLVK